MHRKTKNITLFCNKGFQNSYYSGVMNLFSGDFKHSQFIENIHLKRLLNFLWDVTVGTTVPELKDQNR